MSEKEIIDQLNLIAGVDNFPAISAELTSRWISSNVGLEAIDPVFRFMEENPEIDFGMPGPLVHFLERFYQKGYESKLLDSIYRRPTLVTTWMLNRVINGTKDIDYRRVLLDALLHAARNPLSDRNTLNQLTQFLDMHKR